MRRPGVSADNHPLKLQKCGLPVTVDAAQAQIGIDEDLADEVRKSGLAEGLRWWGL
jgi:hypothetical protein